MASVAVRAKAAMKGPVVAGFTIGVIGLTVGFAGTGVDAFVSVVFGAFLVVAGLVALVTPFGASTLCVGVGIAAGFTIKGALNLLAAVAIFSGFRGRVNLLGLLAAPFFAIAGVRCIQSYRRWRAELGVGPSPAAVRWIEQERKLVSHTPVDDAPNIIEFETKSLWKGRLYDSFALLTTKTGDPPVILVRRNEFVAEVEEALRGTSRKAHFEFSQIHSTGRISTASLERIASWRTSEV